MEKGSFRSGDGVDFRWREFTGKTRALSDFRGRTVVIVSRTSFSGESKMSVLAVEEFLRTAAPRFERAWSSSSRRWPRIRCAR